MFSICYFHEREQERNGDIVAIKDTCYIDTAPIYSRTPPYEHSAQANTPL